MKILWVTSQHLAYVSNELNTKKSGFGGWVMNMINELKKHKNIEIAIAMCHPNANMIKKRVDGVTCYVAKDIGFKNLSDKDRDFIINDFNPDIIHIEGNEFSIHNSFSRVKEKPVILSLQGILSGINPYQTGELPLLDYMLSIKGRNILSAWVLYFRKKFRFDDRVKIEHNTISNVKYISGRTFWDEAHSYYINPDRKYFICNRILRPLFYKERWLCDDFEKNSIFIGNGYYPVKGLHFALDALFYLKKEFPDIKLYVGGVSPIIDNKKSVKHYGYSNIIKKKLKKLNLVDNVTFLGELDEKQMVNIMKKVNVFLLPSLIENSPNTLAEAMLLGTPCVSSYVGGVSDMATDEKDCLFYRANDPVLCAWQIRRILKDKSLAKKLSNNSRKRALDTHDPKENCNRLIKAYEYILKEQNSLEK